MELLFAVPHNHHHQPDDGVTGPNQTPTPPPLMDLVAALEQAALTAKRVSVDPSQTLTALASLRSAHQMIGSFLAQLESQPSNGDDKDEPMFDRMEGEEESRIIDEVEEGMRDCVLQSKRMKRRVSPSWPAGRVDEQEEEEFSSVDPVVRLQRAMNLVFQFRA